MTIAPVSPFGDPEVAVIEPSPVSMADLRRLAVHLLDNGKWNANHLFSGIEAAIAPAVRRVTRSKKFHYSVVADASSLEAIAASADLVITGVGDWVENLVQRARRRGARAKRCPDRADLHQQLHGEVAPPGRSARGDEDPRAGDRAPHRLPLAGADGGPRRWIGGAAFVATDARAAAPDQLSSW